MEIKIYSPTKELSSIVECFWTSKTQESHLTRVLPENCTSLTFHLNESNPFSIFSGIATRYIDYQSSAQSNTLGITFKAGGLSQLTRESLHTIKDKTIASADLIPQFNELLIEKLIDNQQVHQQINTLESLLLKSFPKANSSVKLTPLVVNEILRYSGNIKSIELAKKFHISLRQLERIFKRETGISIKFYSRVIRFNHVIHAIKKFPNKSLLELAFEHNYYDHAHLANEIQFFSGYSPSHFRIDSNLILD